MKILYIILFFITCKIIAQVPNYYISIDFSETPENIKNQLEQLITNTHTNQLPYTSTQFDTWDAVKLTDEVPENTNLVYLIYGFDNNDDNFETDYTRDKDLSCHTSSCAGLWTREHVFARSLANPSLTTDQPGPGTDVHNLRACDADRNSIRSNRLFQESSGNSHITGNGYWYPGDEWKGDVARIVMYMYLRYPTQCLANGTAYSPNSYHPDMPDVFLDWNANDPVSQVEIQRNDVLEGIQGNRNPFIDNPYIATMIWGGTEAVDTWNALSLENITITELDIYPNPTQDFIYFSNPTNNYLDTEIFDISGKRISISKNRNRIDVSNIELGFYILKLSNYNQFKVFKFIKK